MHHKKYNAPKIKHSKGIQAITTIWLVPFIAMVIALWLAFQYYSKVGPLVTIDFKENAGLIAKQSHVKLRNVIVGTVETVSLSEEGDGVTVEIRLKKSVERYLNKTAKFWIVHPDVDSSGITGLDTLLSGSYIEFKAKKNSKTKTYFKGLEETPDEDAKGKTYLLSAPKSYHLKKGSNVYYRMIKVGKVQRVGIAPNGKKINFVIFVYDKYTKYINTKSQFYTTSTVSVDLSKGKLDLKVASLSQIARGGISIYTPTQSLGREDALELTQGHIFPLYKNRNQMRAKHLTRGDNDKVYKFKFNENIINLEIGAAVEFKNFQVGYVIDISSHFDKKTKRVQSVVYAIIHTKGFSETNNFQEGEKTLESLVEEGLKAQLNQTIPMVGSQFIDLVFHKNKNNQLHQDKDFLLFPTIETQEERSILNEVEELVTKVKNLKLEKLLANATKLLESGTTLLNGTKKPIDKILTDLDNSIHNLDKTLNGFEMVANNLDTLTQQEELQRLPQTLQNSLYELTQTLEEIKQLSHDYNGDSRFSAELSLTLQELNAMAESMKKVSKTLERKSNALILGDE